jgi:hypothetical protein
MNPRFNPRFLAAVRAAIIAFVAAMAMPQPAEAQYYDPYRPPPPVYGGPVYGAPQPYGRQPYGDPRYGGPPPGYYNRPPPPPAYGRPPPPRYGSNMGMGCVTSRGTCSTDRPVPIGTGCRCMIPGFGRKRGAVEY